MKKIALMLALVSAVTLGACADNTANRSNRNSSDAVRQDNKNANVNTNANANVNVNANVK